MRRTNYRGVFQDWEVGVAVNIIEMERRRWSCLKQVEVDDLLQECLIHWHHCKEKYDPSAGANRRTFMARVIKNKMSHIIQELTSHKRRMASEAISLDQPVEGWDDDQVLLDKIASDVDCSSDFRDQIALKIDIAGIYKKLTPRQRALCRLMKQGYSACEASRLLNIPWGTGYDEQKRIAAVFKKEGIAGYSK